MIENIKPKDITPAFYARLLRLSKLGYCRFDTDDLSISFAGPASSTYFRCNRIDMSDVVRLLTSNKVSGDYYESNVRYSVEKEHTTAGVRYQCDTNVSFNWAYSVINHAIHNVSRLAQGARIKPFLSVKCFDIVDDRNNRLVSSNTNSSTNVIIGNLDPVLQNISVDKEKKFRLTTISRFGRTTHFEYYVLDNNVFYTVDRSNG